MNQFQRLRSFWNWVWLAGLSLSSGGIFLACSEHRTSAQTVSSASQQQSSPSASPSKSSQAEPVGDQKSGTVVGAGLVDPVLTRGQELFTKQCSICHGANGDGQGKFAYLMNPRPRNLQQGRFKLTTTENLIPSDEDLLRTISRGMPGSAMPPWGHLPQSDLRAIVAYVRHIHKQAIEHELQGKIKSGQLKEDQLTAELDRLTMPGPQLTIPPEPAFDELRWFRGQKIYLEACASCHGASGDPVPEAVKYDDEGYPVPPRSFVNGIFKGGSEGYQLYARILKGLKGTPMPANEGAYSSDEVWDLVHYVQGLAKQGAQERAQLKQGTFVATKVSGSLPALPTDVAWDQARPLYVALTPLWWTENRIEGLVVQALHNGQELALRFSWIDSSQDDRAVKQSEFRDGVAVQFSMSSDPPFYMGDPTQHGGVNIWYWKADRQKNIATGYQDVGVTFPNSAVDIYPEQEFQFKDMTVVEDPRLPITQQNPMYMTAWGAGNLVANPLLKNSVESLVALGPGTLAGKPTNIQLVAGQAVYDRGVWYVQIQRAMSTIAGQEDERTFKSGDYLPVSFAVFNGDAGDRDGKKNISIWQKLVIE